MSARAEDEIAYQLGQIDQDGIRLKKLKYVDVEPNIYFALEGTSSSAFELSVQAFGFDVRADLRCPVSGCNAIDARITLDHMEAFGELDYYSGETSLVVQGIDPEVDLDANTTWLAGLVLGWAFNLAEAVAERVVESALEDALQLVDFETQILGLNQILGQIPQSVVNQLGFDPDELLRNPFNGLTVDISLIAPLSSQVPGKVVIELSHRRPTGVSGSVATNVFGESPRLSWNPVPNAVRYRIYERSSSYNQWQLRGTTSSTQWTSSSVTVPDLEIYSPSTGPWFQYYVVAENSYGIRSSASTTVKFYSQTGGDDCIGVYQVGGNQTKFAEPCEIFFE